MLVTCFYTIYSGISHLGNHLLSVMFGTGIYQEGSSHYVGWHAVKIIGWGVGNGVPYWLCANSWNAEWGDRGFFKILRGSNECLLEQDATAGIMKIDWQMWEMFLYCFLIYGQLNTGVSLFMVVCTCMFMAVKAGRRAKFTDRNICHGKDNAEILGSSLNCPSNIQYAENVWLISKAFNSNN